MIAVSPYIPLNLSIYHDVKQFYSLYCQTVDGIYTAFISVYSNVVNLWADDKANISEIKSFLIENNFDAVYATPALLSKMDLQINKEGKILRLNHLTEKEYSCDYKLSKTPNDDDYVTIAKLLINDPESDSHSDETTTVQRYKSRNIKKSGRSYILYDSNDVVIAHAGTHGESNGIAIIGGVVTRTDCRGRGLATYLVKEICKDLTAEGKCVYLYSFNCAAIKLYKKLGFIELFDWGYADLSR